ncbi:glycine cleavage system protein H [Myxococcota bacterium]|nr:glycine cleavage system protein H [Myxococcota bacterium]
MGDSLTLSRAIKGSFFLIAAIAIAAIGFPLVFLGILAARILIIPLVAFIVLAIIFHPATRRLMVGQPSEHQVAGMPLAANVLLDKTHAWARPVGKGYAIGADSLAYALLGAAESVELPKIGTSIQRGETLFSIKRGNRTIQLRAPMSGKITAINSDFASKPENGSKTPYDSGWAVCMEEVKATELSSMWSGKEALDFFRREVEATLAAIRPEAHATSLAQDGGPVVEDLNTMISDEVFQKITQEHFGKSA